MWQSNETYLCNWESDIIMRYCVFSLKKKRNHERQQVAKNQDERSFFLFDCNVEYILNIKLI